MNYDQYEFIPEFGKPEKLMHTSGFNTTHHFVVSLVW